MNNLKRLSSIKYNVLLVNSNNLLLTYFRHISTPAVKMKRLAALDFDNTIVEGFSDDEVISLLPKQDVPRYKRDGWLLYMQNIFELVHKRNISRSTIEKAVAQMKPVPGMLELIKDLSTNYNFDIVIISDANSHFINTWLQEQNLVKYVRKLFTNPAEFTSDGMLNVRMYQEQDWCTLSERNMCKGDVLEDFVKTQREAGLVYDQIVYVGDGLNDFCPVVRLNRDDLACCRQGFECAEAAKLTKEGKPIGYERYSIKANLVFWNTGYDIINAVKNSLSSRGIRDSVN